MRTGRPLRWVAGLVLFGLVAAVGLVWWSRQPQSAVLPGEPGGPSAAASDPADVHGDAAAALLDRLVAALRTGSRAQVETLAAPGDRAAARELDDLRHNVHVLGITGLGLRYVDEDTGALDPAEDAQLGARGWVADVQLDWRLRGWDRRDSHTEVSMTFEQTPHGAAFVSARENHGHAAPLWLLSRVRAEHRGRALAITTSTVSPRRFLGLADQAVIDVRKVLRHWTGRLVVEVPADQDELVRVLGSQPDAYDGIAAVTTTVDGSRTPGAPTHIFVNPPVFDPLGPHGSQIVMSHEATHVATDAAVSSMPTWLLEGFADFVALDHVDLPVSVTASQILGIVRKHGPPATLPDQRAFDNENKTLGATYESAWLACRLLGQKYGESRLIAFYRASARAGSTTGPFRTVLGTDQRTFTRQWRAYLHRLAG